MSAAAGQSRIGQESVRGVPMRTGVLVVLWAFLLLYLVTRVLEVFPESTPTLGIVALHVLLPAIFAAIHGTVVGRTRQVLLFFAIAFVVGNILENVGVVTGFPFGRYYFLDLMGPKLFHVPILLAVAYVGMGYLSWVLAVVIFGTVHCPLSRSRVVTLPLVASFIMVAWDLSQEPVWATVLHGWVWVRGGAYFGVPISNFIGWYVTMYFIYQLYALALSNQPIARRGITAAYWRPAILLYACCAVGNVLQIFRHSAPLLVMDPSGTQWRVRDITGTCALISMFTMGAFAFIAWVRLADQELEL